MGRYARALQIATAAAREAGSLLRTELHRPEGPRGERGKCPADVEAGALIRERLADAFPDHGRRGEELPERDRRSSDPEQHLWLIDPNDGTSSFLRAFRGSSVSIALLRAGQPVLGVVFAFAAPDDRGDLIAWAEGESLTRNGQVVPARRWPTELTKDVTLLISQYADGMPITSRYNAELVAPARYRPVPGIAYRLALVAAGEGDGCISLAGPGDWDYAAGHALLLGCGGAVVNERGEPVTYTVEGVSEVEHCFGGGPELTAALAKRSWRKVLDVRWEAPTPPDLCWPAAGELEADPGRLERAQGTLLGQLIGDSLGSLVEFQSPAQILMAYRGGVRDLADGGTWGTLAGQPTDDSELALMLARTLIDEGGFDLEAIARGYAYWIRSGPFDIGNTTATALGAAADALDDGRPASEAARAAANPVSQANGALMRVSPLGLFGVDVDGDALAELARADAALTHPHPVCQEASAVLAVAIAWAVREGPSPRELYDGVTAWAEARGVAADVREWLAAAESGPPDDYERNMGWVRIALHNAFHQLLHATTPEEALVDTVGCGGDTDTNAAICGALLGAVHGRDGWPRRWVDGVLTCRPIAGLDGVRRPRPRPMWPVDALVVAERLVAAGRRH